MQAGRKTYKLVAVKDMARVYGFGEKKIQSIISKYTPIPDEDAPDVAEECRYWVLVDQERLDTSTTRSHG